MLLKSSCTAFVRCLSAGGGVTQFSSTSIVFFAISKQNQCLIRSKNSAIECLLRRALCSPSSKDKRGGSPPSSSQNDETPTTAEKREEWWKLWQKGVGTAEKAVEKAEKEIIQPYRRTKLTVKASEELKRRIAREMAEEMPKTGLIAKFKWYSKRYWPYFLGTHILCCSFYFGVCYLAVKYGVDVVTFFKALHIPESIIAKIENVSPTTGNIVVATILYKVLTPLRYATTVAALTLFLRVFGVRQRMTAIQTMDRALERFIERRAKFSLKYKERREKFFRTLRPFQSPKKRSGNGGGNGTSGHHN